MTRPSLDRPLRIGTRGSPLALAQANAVARALRTAHAWPDEAVEIVPIVTTGDVVQDRPLAELGGKALWTKELDRALADGRTDLSVHSMKDVETVRPDALIISAMLPRADARDRLIGAASLADLPQGARVGTSSPRRAAQLRARRPDLDIVMLRGNIQTRLAKVAAGEVDATLLAAAGLVRLGLHDVGTPVDELLPAPSQGAIGVETLKERGDIGALVESVDDLATHICVDLERGFLLGAGGDCQSAAAAHATLNHSLPEGAAWRDLPDIGPIAVLRAELIAPDGREVVAGETSCGPRDPAASDLARDLLGRASPALRAMYAA